MKKESIKKYIEEINEELKELDLIYESNHTYEGYPEWENEIIELQMKREIAYDILDEIE